MARLPWEILDGARPPLHDVPEETSMSRTVIVADIPLKFKEKEPTKLDPSTHIRVQVYYEEGGTCMLSGTSNARGFYASARSVRISEHSVSFVMFKGTKSMLEVAGRFNAKRLATLAAEFKKDPKFNLLVASVLRTENLELADVQAPTVGCTL
jgi:hypothetical protein